MYKSIVTLIPTSYSHRALNDIVNFAKILANTFEVVIILDEIIDLKIDKVKLVKAHSYEAKYYLYTSEYIIDAGTTTRKDRVSSFQKRISVWHGTPIKKMFVDLSPKYVEDALNYAHGYDLMISPSKYYTDCFLKNSMLYTNEILEIGSSRMDNYFVKPDNNLKQKLKVENKKIVLYAPTYREKGSHNLPFDVNKLQEIIGEEFVILVKLHYTNTLIQKNVIDVTEFYDITELLKITDILITDYSSLLIDYAVLKKPFLLYLYDNDLYRNERGLMFDLYDYISKDQICYTESELREKITSNLSFDNKKIIETFYPFEKGNSTNKIINYINPKCEYREIRDIIFLVNDLNQIGGVHNFCLNLGKNFKEKYNSRLFIIAINEFNDTNESNYVFDIDDLFDFKLSLTHDKGAIEAILKMTYGLIISTQFSVHMCLQKYLKNKRTILMFHGDTKDIVNKTLYPNHLAWLNTLQIYNYQELVVLTKSNMEILRPKLNKKIRISHIANNVDYKENLYDFDSNIFVAVTRFDVDKNPIDLINIFRSNNINKNYKLHIYGDGPLFNEIQLKIKEYNLGDKVILKGYINNKLEIYIGKKGLVFTSRSEGLGLVILEAYSYGIPVYCFDSFSSVSELVPPGCGIIVKSSEEFVTRLNDNQKFSSISIKNFIENYSTKKILEQWDTLIRETNNTNQVTNKGNIQINLNIKDNVIRKYQKLPMKQKLYIRNYLAHIEEIYKIKTLKIKPLISIIIPYYNNEDTILECLNSIDQQLYKNIEVIIIDDGSQFDFDQSILSKKHTYIKTENNGPGKARNLGIKEASGKYCFFLDADDTLCTGALVFLLYYAEKNKLSVVSGKTSRVDNYDKYKRHVWFYNIYKDTYINLYQNRSWITKDTLCTNKLYNMIDLKRSKIEFETGLYEDKLFIQNVYSHFDKVGIISNHIYNWHIYGENTSITTTLSFENFLHRMNKIEKIWSLSNEKDKMNQYHFAINHDFRIYIDNFHLYSSDEQCKMFTYMSSFLINNKRYLYKKNIPFIKNIAYLDALLKKDLKRFNLILQFYKEQDE